MSWSNCLSPQQCAHGINRLSIPFSPGKGTYQRSAFGLRDLQLDFSGIYGSLLHPDLRFDVSITDAYHCERIWVRLNLDHNASRACNHNNMQRHATHAGIMTRSSTHEKAVTKTFGCDSAAITICWYSSNNKYLEHHTKTRCSHNLISTLDDHLSKDISLFSGPQNERFNIHKNLILSYIMRIITFFAFHYSENNSTVSWTELYKIALFVGCVQFGLTRSIDALRMRIWFWVWS